MFFKSLFFQNPCKTVASVLDCMYRAKAFACGNSHSSGSFSTPLALQMFVYPDMFQEEH